ncbi:MAG: dienelactone hydrolase family protein [Armatimonadetes bacterium]|nr:dienelactone hydrolase family protein [Armatimonadota bacterium]
MKARAALGRGWLSLPASVIMRVAWCVLFVALLSVPTASLAQPAPQWVDVEGAGGAKLRAAVFRPGGDGPFPIVMLLHGASGLGDEVVGWGPDLSRAGFLVVAGCFGRGGSVQGVPPCPEAPLINETFAVRNLAALIEAARRLPGVQRDRIGLAGWSWGAAVATLAASSGIDVQAVVAVAGSYGLRISRNDPSALSQLDRLSAPVLILHGTNDVGAPVRSARNYESSARAQGKSVEAYYFEGAGHDIWFDPRFRAEVIGRAVEFLQRHLAR